MTLNPQEQGKTATISVEIRGEKIAVPQDLAVTWRDLLTHRADAFVDLKAPITLGNPTEFNYGVLGDLREDIDILRHLTTNNEDGLTDLQIYRNLALRYHPDVINSDDPKVQQLAGEYTQALNALVAIGELQIEDLKIEASELK